MSTERASDRQKVTLVTPFAIRRCVGDLDDVGVEIDADHRSSGPDQAADQEAHVAHAAANVEDVHAGTDPGRAQHPFRQRPKQLGLLDQAVVLGIRPAKRVVGVLQQATLPR